MPRHSDSPIGLVLLALVLLANIPLLATAQEAQQKRPLQESFASASPLGKSTHFETNDNENINNIGKQDNYNDNVYNSHDVRAIATTLAPAAPEQKGAAVRAPLAKRPVGATGGLSRLTARSLQDWDVEDVVLLATVDGRIHAHERLSGTPIWELEADRPVIETTYHDRIRSINGTSSITDDILWIVEPSQDGALYGYVPGVSTSIMNLGLSVKDLHENTPFVSEEPPIRYLVDRKTWLYTIDISNGNIQKMFTAGGSAVVDENSCRKVSGLEHLDDDACPVTGSLTLGRTEYNVQISSTVTSELICTIRYFEWGPNQRDRDLISQYASTKDNRYVYTRPNGEVVASHLLQGNEHGMSVHHKPFYKHRFPAPVVQVFDVARPSDDESPNAPLIVLPQPSAPMFIGHPEYGALDRVFVNCTEGGSWYALSEYHYPMVTQGVSDAPCLSGKFHHSMVELRNKSDPVFRMALAGVHDLGLVGHGSHEVTIPLIGGPPEEPLIAAPPEDPPLIGLANVESIGGRLATFWSSRRVSAIVLLCIAIISAMAWPRIQQTYLASKEDVKIPAATQPIPVPNPQPDTADADVPIVESTPALGISIPERPRHRPRASTTTSLTTNSDSNSDRAESRRPLYRRSETAETFRPELQRPGLQRAETALRADEIKSSSPKKKKAHRGNRGGRAQKEREKAKAKSRSSSLDPLDTGRKPEQELTIQPDVISKHAPNLGDSHGLRNLHVHFDRILGSGSGGTFVFEGTFENRDVAVKRMLRQQYELASQEVSLLEQNDEHINVIRYFCRREDENFLYIALELCQASLWDLFRDGRGGVSDPVEEKHLALRDEILQDPRRALRQLAEGLGYLHGFRIVHRDIKPQNMLVAYPRRSNLKSYPRLVISDFGLCKTLPENVSTLLSATGNAGTAGWMAPELISQPGDISAPGSAHNTRTNDPNQATINANGQQPSGKVKRAIDIFSLGCVFFYVLTQGQHPFDDEEGWMALRERNIKIGRARNMKALEMLGPDTVDLVTWMLHHDPEQRPTAAQVLAHPFFWDAEDRLEFLSAASDRFDQESRDGTSTVLRGVESYADAVIPKVVPSSHALSATHSHLRTPSPREMQSTMHLPIPECNFLAQLDKRFIDTLGRQRKYDPAKLTDLLRALRNKFHHWDDMPEDVKAKVGEVPEGYLAFWENRFPCLVVKVWRAVGELGLGGERRFGRWFNSKGNVVG
ncbi:MAG: hypothetical protein Q9162_002238 [Coniocarpon cinnabarinum]